MATRESPSTPTPTVFEQQREELVKEIAVGMEEVLQNINRLNRNLESVISVGKEFSSVEALWSQFENFSGRPEEGSNDEDNANLKQQQQQGDGHGHGQAEGREDEEDDGS